MTDPGFDLSGKRALITGASSGIGVAVTTRLAEAGATVVGVSRSGRTPDTDGAVTPLVADLADRDQLDAVVDRGVAELGGLDILVNNAGHGEWRPLADVDAEYFDAMVGLNLWAPLRLCQKAHPHLAVGEDAAVVMIGSVDAVRPSAGASVYGATKAGLGAATVALAKEWMVDGIRVSQVDPGLVDTPMSEDGVDALEEGGAPVNIVGRAGRPEEVAGLVHYLVAPIGRFATGTSYRLDGGALAMGPFDAGP